MIYPFYCTRTIKWKCSRLFCRKRGWKDKIEYMVMIVAEFAKRYRLTTKQAYRYIVRYKGFELCEEFYGIMHTLSIDDDLDSLATYCRKNGGLL